MKPKILSLIFLFFIAVIHCGAQSKTGLKGTMVFDGVVYGSQYDVSRKLLKKSQEVVLEGVLEGVSVSVTENGNILFTSRTNRRGEFKLKLKFNHLYKLELSKEGYEKSSILIDTRKLPDENTKNGFTFTGTEFLLNSFPGNKEDISNNEDLIGRIYFNTKGQYFDFTVNENRYKKTGLLGRKIKTDNQLKLLKRSVLKNRNAMVSGTIKEPKSKSASKDSLQKKNNPTHSLSSNYELSAAHDIKARKDVIKRQEEIRRAKRQLERDKKMVKTREDSLIVSEREARIRAAEFELENAKKVIAMQEAEIQTQKKILFFSIMFLLLVLGLSFVIYIHYKDKRQINILLSNQNQKILDSINYAKRIQQSILTPEKELQKFLPESFVFYQPKDIVSGDFYWFSAIDSKLVVSAIDCTGHGVPGAFMSLIGNNLLNEIINDKLILDPALILQNLHSGILKVLRQEDINQSEDGMEMSLCIIDFKNRLINYAGAMNPLYIIHDKSLQIIHGDVKSIGGKNLRPDEKEELFKFSNKTIKLQENMAMYLFTDGYLDQFGGERNIKFNTTRFKNLLLDIHEMNMQEQKDMIQNTLFQWKGNNKQTDDILVMGIKFNML